MRTYSKRHRTVQQDVLNNVVIDGQTGGKRDCHSETEGPPRKRKRFIDQSAMSGTFETPHPTLGASSEVYKLPSTKPISSPTPFSPVPITAPAHSLDLRAQPYLETTKSGSLKENVGSRRSTRQRQSSKTLSSFTLTSGSGPASRNTRQNGKNTRSPSRSSNSASSRSRSRDQTRLSKFKSKLIKNSKFKPNATINDMREHHPSKPKQMPLLKSKSFSRRNKFIPPSSSSEHSLLASPFASRAPSPTKCSQSDLVKCESMGPPALADSKLVTQSRHLSKVYVDLSVIPRTRNQSFHRKMGQQACGVFGSPEKPGTRKRSPPRLSGPGRINENDLSWKNRRPSAPSSLQRPAKAVGKAHIPAKAGNPGRKQFKEENGIQRHTSELRNSLPSQFIDPIKDFGNKLSVELNDNPDWMQERFAVDFNRPPSQSSFHSGSNRAEDDGGVFWSSEEDNDQPNHLEATNPLWLNSTPYNTVMARLRSLPISEGPSITLAEIKGSFGDDDKNGEDMELTTPLECEDTCQKDSMFLQEHTPWTTDSIISPPTPYSKRKKPVKEKEVDENVKKEELIPAGPLLKTSPSLSMVRTQTGMFSSPSGSYAESTSSLVEASIGLHEGISGGNQERNEEVAVTDGTQDKGHLQGSPQGTRSGDTILAARNGASIARRTRTGTIVGPSKIGRTRSGTIVAKVKVPEQNVAVAGIWRTRSGSIIGPVPDPSVSGKKRPCTGSVTKLEPLKILDIAGAEEEIHARVNGKSPQIQNIGKGCESSIEEVNEAECYVDSLYLTSSPDPINFLTGAKIDGDESALVVAVGEWQVADEPPSPETRRSKKALQTPCGMGGRSITRRFKLKGNRKNRARFLGADGHVENYIRSPNFEDGLSDDELLLVEGQSQSLFC